MKDGRIAVGRADVSPDTPAHTPGVPEGNAPGGFESEPGHYLSGQAGKDQMGKATGRRSTSINPASHDPVVPGGPTLPPP